jgi:penicillin-binding protein 1C
MTWKRIPLSRRAALGTAGAVLLGLGVWVRCGPLPDGFLDPGPHVSTEVTDRDGEPLYESLSPRGQRSRGLSAQALPRPLVDATLSAEDSRFFSHPGVDPIALCRAGWHDLRARRIVEGGSTITQQVVKIILGQRRSVPGKLREMVLALRLEHRLSKQEILTLYLNLAPYGNSLTGASAASQAYFGSAVENLTPAQAALLAGLPQRPSAFDPYRHRERALRRQHWVLGRMRATGRLATADAARAEAEELRFAPRTPTFVAPHFVARVLSSVPGTPRRIETTLDAGLQAQVQGIVEMHRDRLRAHGAHNVAVAVLDNRRGEWLAWEGSGDHGDAEHGGAIDGVISPRQPGSALKPFTYALAFENGFTPATVLPDVPAHFPTAVPGVLYSPRNYDGIFRGPMRVRAALAGSENVPAVWTLSQVGVPDLLRLLRRAGFTTLDRTAEHYGYGLTMGDAEVRLDELVAAYAAFVREGRWTKPRLVRAVTDAQGRREAAEEATADDLFSPQSAYWVTDILSDHDARAFAFGRGGSLEFPFPVAAKTGTSQAYHDNWTVGFTREVTVGVWVGNFDRAPLQNSSGVTGAAPIFHDVLVAAQARAVGTKPGGLSEALDADGLVTPPAAVASRVICALSGRRATEACPRVLTESLPAEGEMPMCRWHVASEGTTVVVWPPAYRGWARERGLLDSKRLARLAPPAALQGGRSGRVARGGAAAVIPEGPPLRIVNPPAGATYLADPTLRAEFQTLPLRAMVSGPAGRLRWSVDGRPVGTSGPDDALDWPLVRGPHVVEVADDRGLADRASILVK